MKIRLIDPPGFGEGISTGLAYLAAMAIKGGFEDIKVVDIQNYRDCIDQRLDLLIKERPAVIGVTVNSFTVINALKIIDFIKPKLPQTKFIAGGPGVTSDPRIFLERTGRLFDVVIFGEGEQTFLELLNYYHYQSPNNLKQIDGLAYRLKDQVVVNPKRKLNYHLDTVPLPNYDVFDSIKTGLVNKNYQILTSRGCPGRCVFCMNIVLNQGVWRGRSVENVIEELILAKQKYAIQSFTIRDDNFTQDIDRAEKICERLIDLNFAASWKCKAAIRADRVRPSLLMKMKQSGCGSLTLGIESGDRNIFPLVKKGESLETIVEGIKMIKKADLEVEATMVIGLINDSYHSVLTSINFLKKIKVKAHWYLALPFRGTALFHWVQQNGRFLVDCDFIDAYHHFQSKELIVPFETDDFTAEQRRHAYYRANIASENFHFVWIDGFVQSNRYKHLGRSKRALVLLSKVLKYHPAYFLKAIKYLFKIGFAKYLS